MKKSILLIMLITIVMSSCQKLPPFENLSSNFVVTTNYEDGTNFKSYKYFAISDTIRTITSNPKDTVWYDANAQAIIQRVTDSMTTRGYVKVPPKAPTKDLAIQIYGLRNTTIYAIPQGYWWGYYPGWGCYWGYCGGGYYPWYPYYYYTSVSTGTLIIEIADFKNASGTKVPIVWDGVGAGQVGNSNQFIVDQCLRTVDVAFGQSPYLNNK